MSLSHESNATPTTGTRARLVSAPCGATLTGVDFARGALASAHGPALLWLERCTFAEADLRQATLDGWHFMLCDLSGADLRGASLRDTSFAGCDLTEADLRGADLTGVSFAAMGVGAGATGTRLDRVRADPGVVLKHD